MMAVNAAFPHQEHGTWAQCERLLPQALAVARGKGGQEICTMPTGSSQ